MLFTSDDKKLRSVLHLAPEDNVVVACLDLKPGEFFEIVGHSPVKLHQRILIGHKVALCTIKKSEKIVKFGMPIGSAAEDISPGNHVHTHNMQSDYIPTHTLESHRTGPEVL